MNAIRDQADSVAGHFMNFVTGLFALLLASHFAGSQLSRLNHAILLGVFTVFSLITGGSVVAAGSDLSALAEALSAIPGRTLSSAATPSMVLASRWLAASALIAGYVAGVAFLRESRKHSLKYSAPGRRPRPEQR